ncbi:efflux RND transporter permease subunit, partial [Escherichia coli]|uniref:efflux RND transporter permease subunit n=1 Tax=Escherichia coli TaxID=562 RepID=UPI001915265D
STATTTIENAMHAINMPASISGGFAGSAKVFQQALANELFLILAALATIYISLGMLYESYVHPLTILSTLTSAGVGAVAAIVATALAAPSLSRPVVGALGAVLTRPFGAIGRL